MLEIGVQKERLEHCFREKRHAQNGETHYNLAYDLVLLVRIDLGDKSACCETKAQLHIALWFSIDSAPLAITFLAKNTTVN